jgi:hypothetical protein
MNNMVLIYHSHEHEEMYGLRKRNVVYKIKEKAYRPAICKI